MGIYVLLGFFFFFTWNASIQKWVMLMLLYCFCGQLINEFVEKENIPFEGVRAEILLGRDTRPSGESLLEAAKQVHSLFLLITMNFALIF